MFALGILIGIFSYFIFGLGILRILYVEYVILISLVFIILGLLHLKKRDRSFIFNEFKLLRKSKASTIILFLILVEVVINLIGAIGPELGFDALWYHLTLPKIYLANHSIEHIPGGLLYYSSMPKLTEMIYTAALSVSTEILAKVIHLLFGVLSALGLYFLSRRFFNTKYSLLTVLVFYSNLVVGWQSITAYVDLTRTFFEVLSLWGFIIWWKEKKLIWLIEAGVFLGLAISTKLLSLGSILIFASLIFYHFVHYGERVKVAVRNLLVFLSISLLIPLPWFIFSAANTGSPIFPLFSSYFNVNFNLGLVNLLKLSDPVSPLYLIFFPLMLLYFIKFTLPIKVIAIYSIIAYLIFCITPQTGGGRFILPYLPAFSIIIAAVIQQLSRIKLLKTISLIMVILVAFIFIFQRGISNAKFIPYILGIESKDHFLTNNLNFLYGDFYDTDGYFKTHIKSTDRVLLYGFHNLFYVNFPFIDSSYIKKGDKFNFIATQNAELPERFKFWNLVYSNPTTKVNLYYLGGQTWIY